MLTGDSESGAKTGARALGITEYRSQVLPEDKSRIVEELKAEGKTVIMVGDGINDSPALAAADVSVSMKHSSDIAREVADISLLSDDLYDLVTDMNNVVWDGKVLDYKTQKLIAIGITASRADPRAIKKQIRSAIEVLRITPEEIVDVLRVVLLTSGMPAFSKSLQILNSVVASMDEEENME